MDQKIVSILQKNGRLPVSELSKQVGLSKTPCQARLKKLQASGVILGFRAVVNNEVLGRNHIAFTEVKLSDTRDAALKACNEAVRQIPEIEQCHMIAGQFD